MRGSRPFFLFLLLTSIVHLFILSLKLQTPQNSPQQALRLKIETHHRKFPNEGKQIVASEDSESPVEPHDSDFLSDKDRSFDRQSRAKNGEKFEKASRGDANVTYQGKQQKLPTKKKISLSDLGIGKATIPETRSQKGVRSGDPNSRGISSTSDYLPEIPLGDLTHLNTKEYKFYGFYHRIRQKLEQFWGRSLADKARQMAKAGRRIASDELLTSLQITLDSQGEITAIKILGPSGIRELDDAAVESFNEAGPFPNPPRDLIVDGEVVIEWGFVVKI